MLFFIVGLTRKGKCLVIGKGKRGSGLPWPGSNLELYSFLKGNFLLKFYAFVAVAFNVCCGVQLGNRIIFADISN
jgi:hypothetical protein